MKRILDFISSLIGLIILLPIFFIIYILIKIDSRGPVFFRQIRVGRNNKDFRLYKFRSMYLDSDKHGVQLTVGRRDPRITKVGYYLRKFKIDELPQLINVLIGEMSIVGPRPELRKYVDCYTPQQMRVLSINPGITDNASIEFIDESALLEKANDPEQFYISELIPKKTAIYLKYVDNHSFWMDIKIIFRTIFNIFIPKKNI